MYIAILGRQPELSLAELSSVSGQATALSRQTALVADAPSIDRLGGSQKIAQVVAQYDSASWKSIQNKIIDHYLEQFSDEDNKITLGISVYDFAKVSARDVQGLGLALKRRLKNRSASLRLLPSKSAVLPTASSLHNKLGSASHKREIIIVKADDGRVLVAETIAVQNLDAYTKRDQARPKRDAFVGMLPPKLAQIMINLATATNIQASSGEESAPTILDPFCGTGVILQEAALMGYKVYGTDLSDKMIDYSQQNLAWLADSHHISIDSRLNQADAMDAKWRQPINAVVCETYLGQPFSAPPSPKKLREVIGNCDHIISDFLTNISKQIQPGTTLCIAVPAWRDVNGWFAHLPLTKQLDKFGLKPAQISDKPLLYYREDQVVARELIVLTK